MSGDPATRAKQRRDRLRSQGLCTRCGLVPLRHQMSDICSICFELTKPKAKERTEERKQRRQLQLQQRSGPNGWRDPKGECLRCSARAVKGEKLCAAHLEVMAEMAKEGTMGGDE